METVDRAVGPLVTQLLASFRVVILQGARQVGKSTLARDLVVQQGGTLIDLDDPLTLDALEGDPHGALDGEAAPIVVDEFQRGGPELLLAVKSMVDRDPTPGRFLLTGSANYLAARHHVETLAGRNVKVALWPLSQGELGGQADQFFTTLLSDPNRLGDLRAPRPSRDELAERICRGGFPEVALGRIPTEHRWRWFAAYAADCTDREALRGVADVRKTDELRRTLALLALRTGTELVLQHVRRDLGDAGSGLDHKTLVGFVDLLEALHLLHRLPAWSSSATPSARKHPKVHLVDTGLAAGLARIGPDRLTAGFATERIAGQLLETFVVNELAKQGSQQAEPVRLGHYRGTDHEVDIVVEAADGRFAAIETKAGAPRPGDARHLVWLRDRHPDRFLVGVVLHGASAVTRLGDRLWALPVSALWG